MFFLVNVLTLWDYQCLFALEDWRQESGQRLRTWLQVLAEVEALSSLANIRFEHPEWAMPQIISERGQPAAGSDVLHAENMGHPLLQQPVTNHFSLGSSAQIALITGSNMSGKSTFLRTVGCNLVLAYAGAPVCASGFRCSLFHLWTCMRVSDNLEQSISSFYAEVLRIKRIAAAAKNQQQVFFLLDEIFKGTNSQDRHIGARALISQLQRDGAYGLVSTHDLELGDLQAASNGKITNYHFREYYENSQIRFDYRLRAGISTTRNALYLIRMAGIELEDELEV
ncbi:MAG: MutS family DNA mismatch repair protein [Bacillota bacterium]